LKTGWKSLAWSAASVVLLLSLVTPLNILTFFVTMVPFIVLFTSLNLKTFLLHAIPIGAIAFLLAGELGPLVLTAAFILLVPSLAMGYMYKRGSTARATVTAGFFIILAQILLVLLLFSLLYNIDIKAEIAALVADNLKQFEASNLFKPGWVATSANAFSDLFMSLLPTRS